MKKVILFSFFIFCIFCKGVFAQSPEEIYRKANLSYENEDYEKAASLYEALINMDRVSYEAFYNLGNSYFKLKKIGKAIVNYERARKLAPRDRDVMLNLKLARSMAIDKIETKERGFLLNSILFFYDKMNINELTGMVSIIYLAISTLLIFSIFLVAKRKKILYTVGTLGAFLVLFAIFLVFKIHNENFVRHAIIISDAVNVRSGPKDDYLLQFELHEGAKVRIVEETKDWCEINLSKDLRGWLPKDSIEVI
ncbi:MAG: tetratricopeptide repeat protein [Candidatus Omnitrophica bacterium]|nr:tetratricopeptide repeat protein [Candidatus Omnitrophota bacterium]